MVPSKPAFVVSVKLSLGTVTSLGASTPDGFTTIGLRTMCEPSFQNSRPLLYSPNAALVRVNVTLNVPVSPGARVSVLGVTVVEIPARPVTEALYVELVLSTLVTDRLTVSLPAMEFTAIDGTFRFDAFIGVFVNGVPSPKTMP